MSVAVQAVAQARVGYHRTIARDAYNRTTAPTEVEFSFEAHIYPQSDRERLLIPEGLRLRETVNILTEGALLTAKEADASSGGQLGDIAVYEGDRYEVYSETNRSTNPIAGLQHRKYLGARENPA